MNHLFHSPRDYFQFVCAKGYYQPGADHLFDHHPNYLEKIGDRMLHPFTTAADRTLKNIRNPAVLSSITITALALVTIAYYPSQLIKVIKNFVPFLFEVKNLRFGLYAVSQYHILALGIRTLGRLSNHSHLLPAWTRREIVPISIGSQLR
jgi:hypothetical protein